MTRCPTLSGDDLDEVAAEDDNCSERFNPGQEDADRDGVGDACDGCPDAAACSCLPGTWDDDGDPATACLACQAGEFCPGGLDAPLACGDATWDADGDPATPCTLRSGALLLGRVELPAASGRDAPPRSTMPWLAARGTRGTGRSEGDRNPGFPGPGDRP